jgi:hypothetical protein
VKAKVVDSYMADLETLNPQARLDIISRLAQSLKPDLIQKENLLKCSFGAWSGTETAEELLKAIRKSRNADSQMTEL